MTKIIVCDLNAYTYKNNIILIDRSDFSDDVLVSNKLAIRKLKDVYESEKQNDYKYYLVQLDNNNNEIKNHYVYAGIYGKTTYIPFNFDIIENNQK